ncbi:DUF4231 domain-containing protein [Mesorhizobium sp. M00.F.Ca.ET.217.01.1.1]|uniref:DUF4231 domain-containing protein n=1 Tax=Mesorhizobium sp. M00.F.Ca.ET.217.01.1.1 TaxID=2500529 RepID=UPI000FDC3C3F|nr:DUF4231 domain-containing protein [Mesorhizobium sp. M00.F.Ca.ET.217.01.1.1]TGQ13584.1 DUF4231 domain-containing protein [Mesorhizobium sp. M00.F.Ca.ET.217.01.1.1]TGV85448.1 DUF4231 domain-containing protein [Mesorhizobium sp. M00.F.Ca.ET.158.01.1.1]
MKAIPGTEEDEPNSGYSRLEAQIGWYDREAGAAQRYYKRVKFAEIVLSALVPIIAPWQGWAAAGIGLAALLLEGLQQLNQWQHNWITYRSTCEALRHEKYTYLGRSGAYDGMNETRARKTLVERVESLVSTEHSKWITRQEYQLKSGSQGDANKDQVSD